MVGQRFEAVVLGFVRAKHGIRQPGRLVGLRSVEMHGDDADAADAGGGGRGDTALKALSFATAHMGFNSRASVSTSTRSNKPATSPPGESMSRRIPRTLSRIIHKNAVPSCTSGCFTLR